MTMSREQVPKDRIKSIAKGSPSKHFVQEIGRLPGLSCAGIPKKFLEGRFQLYFGFVNKVILPRTEKRIVASVVDLLLMEALINVEDINLPAIMLSICTRLSLLRTVSTAWDMGICRRVFNHFAIPLGKGIKGTIKQAISLTILIKCECVEGRTGNKGKSQVSELLEQQEQLKHELEEMTVIMASRNAEIARLNAQLLIAQAEGPGVEEMAALKAENESLNAKVANLKEHCFRLMLK
ncbi:hypothetical protein KY290_007934 [Solanum tuberosum]|uniref:Uncharacterized protein n=1 Tax=Solanum tuberosum TaxID=4113 RepID=A0ABQ7W726_SOLTU|nr:hypothetical protein KY290_007934 [Solanum tuberosum]